MLYILNVGTQPHRFSLGESFYTIKTEIFAKKIATRIQRWSSSTEGRLPPQVVFNCRLSSKKDVIHRMYLPPKIIYHQRSSSSSTKGCLSPKVVFHRWLSSTKGCLPPKVVFHRSLSLTEGCLTQKVVFHQRSSSTETCLPPKVVLPKVILHLP